MQINVVELLSGGRIAGRGYPPPCGRLLEIFAFGMYFETGIVEKKIVWPAVDRFRRNSHVRNRVS